MRLQRPNRGMTLEGLDQVPVQTGYFRGRDISRWVRAVAHYAKVRYRNVYPGVDLVFRQGDDGRLEYDWVVAPGASPHAIRTKFDRTADLRVDKDGDLIVSKDGFEWRHRKARAYQPAGGNETPVTAAFRAYAKGETGFEVGRYDHGRTLIIDPVLASSLNTGGVGQQWPYYQGVAASDIGSAVALGPQNLGGSIYVAGAATTLDFPVNNSPFGVHKQGADAFVAVASEDPTSGSVAISAVYFLGGSGDDAATGMALDAQGNVYITGYTDSPDFPLVNAAQTASGGGFAAKFNANFSTLVYSTYVGMAPSPIPYPFAAGASDQSAIAVDASGAAYLTGATDTQYFTASKGAFQGAAGSGQTSFVLKLDASGKLAYATLLGGSVLDYGLAITVDTTGSAYVTGFTESPDFPVTTGVLEPSCAQCGPLGSGAFVTKLNPTGTGLVFSTFLGGGSGASANGIAVDAAGNSYVAGGVAGSGIATFPTTPGAFQRTPGAQAQAAFVAKLNPAASALVYSTLLSGTSGNSTYNGEAAAAAIALDSSDNSYVTGWTGEIDFPLVQPLQTVIGSQSTCDFGIPCGDAFIAKLSADGSTLDWSTYFGGSFYDAGAAIAVSGQEVLVAGTTGSPDFPGLSSAGPGSVFLLDIGQAANAPGVSAIGVTSAASFVTGLAPGGLATIFGSGFTNTAGVQVAQSFPLPLQIDGVSVMVGGIAAPLLALANVNGAQQINFVTPWEVANVRPDQTTSVVVSVNGVSSIPVQPPFAGFQPAVYLYDGMYAAAQHGSNYALITPANPALPGEILILYADGLGLVQPAVALGAAAPSSPPSMTVVNPVVTIGGASAVVQFSGLAPGFASLYQLNVRVPPGAQAGEQSVLISVQTPHGPIVSPAALLPVGQSN